MRVLSRVCVACIRVIYGTKFPIPCKKRDLTLSRMATAVPSRMCKLEVRTWIFPTGSPPSYPMFSSQGNSSVGKGEKHSATAFSGAVH